MKQFLIFLILAGSAAAAPMSESLGPDLVYIRIHALPGDLPASPASGRHAWILDVRYVKADTEEAALLESWIRVNCANTAPVFLLANPQTSPEILQSFAARVPAGLITVGPQAPGFSTDIRVVVKPEIERQAYEAFEHGSTLKSLTTDYPDKPRIDEEKLTREHIPDTQAPDDPVDDPKHPTQPPLIDLVLQRSLQVERGLSALKRL